MSQDETEQDRDRLIAETVAMQRAKLAATRTEQANTSMIPWPNAPESVPLSWQPIGSVADRLRLKIEALAARAKAENAAKREAFLVSGGQCVGCFDAGECVDCERGLAEIAARVSREVQAVIDKSGIPLRFRRCTFDTFPGRTELAADVRSFADTWNERQNLILAGLYGVGKTGLMASAVNELAPRFWNSKQRVMFVTTPMLFDRLRAGYSDGSFAKTMQQCQNVDLLILDDLGAEKPTEWVQERLYAIVNHRYEREMPTWATTNKRISDLSDSIGERTWWRLQEGACLLVATGPNLREGKP